MNSDQFEHILHQLADSAQNAIEPHFRQFQRAVGTLSNKDSSGGFDPVTEADRAAETAIRETLERLRPDDAVFGEEFGRTAGSTGLEWIVDPIDGTRAFVAGLATWGTIIGLVADDVPQAGIFSQSFTGERFWGSGGKAWYRGGRAPGETAMVLRTSAVAQLSEATLMTTSPGLFSGPDRARYDAVEARVKLARYGADGYAYCLLAAGLVDLVIEEGLQPYDVAGLIPIVQGAGGVMSDWQGHEVSVAGGHVLAAANPTILAAAVEALA